MSKRKPNRIATSIVVVAVVAIAVTFFASKSNALQGDLAGLWNKFFGKTLTVTLCNSDELADGTGVYCVATDGDDGSVGKGGACVPPFSSKTGICTDAIHEGTGRKICTCDNSNPSNSAAAPSGDSMMDDGTADGMDDGMMDGMDDGMMDGMPE